MTSGRLQRDGRLRWDQSHVSPAVSPHFGQEAAESYLEETRVDRAINRGIRLLVSRQHTDGFWQGPSEGHAGFEADFVLLLAFLQDEQSDVAKRLGKRLVEQQNANGGWSQYPGGPNDISITVKSYLALKILGHAPNSDCLRLARMAVLDAGGAEIVDPFTRYLLAALGIIEYSKCPAMPPELLLLPKWSPLNLSTMATWMQRIIIPLSVIWARKPVDYYADRCQIPELFHTSPDRMPLFESYEALSHPGNRRKLVPWRWFFRQADWCCKFAELFRLTPFRALARRRAEEWFSSQFGQNRGVETSFHSLIFSLIALKSLGHDERSANFKIARAALDRHLIAEGDSLRVQPVFSTVNDTATTAAALKMTAARKQVSAAQRAIDWLIRQESRHEKDGTTNRPGEEPSGWSQEADIPRTPDVGTTARVLSALVETLPGGIEGEWLVEFLQSNTQPTARISGHTEATILTGQSQNHLQAMRDIAAMEKSLEAIRRGVRWLITMQNEDGGWPAFETGNDAAVADHFPLADHGAMTDPSTADMTSSVLEVCGGLGINHRTEFIRRGIEFVWSQQETDGAWRGHWGVNYLFGTWKAICGLLSVGVSPNDSRIRRAVDWLKVHQNEDGGWGESPASTADPYRRGEGKSSPTQTAWALLALLAAGEANRKEVDNGIDYLLQIQRASGHWPEREFCGTGFPGGNYLKCELDSLNFPLMALSRYRDVQNTLAVSDVQSLG